MAQYKDENKLKLPLYLPEGPSKTDKFFESEGEWWNNACLNYAADGWYLYAIGYKEAADSLVKSVIKREIRQDIVVYPILFLYRQHLELILKDIIRQGRRLLDINEKFPLTHRIDELWTICTELLRNISPDDSIEEQHHIRRLISEFCHVDPTSMAFRYPEDKNGKLSLPGFKNINIESVKDVIEKISTTLLGAGSMIDEYISIQSDMYSNSV